MSASDADIDAFLESLRGTLKAERPPDLNAFVHKYSRARLQVDALSSAEKVSLLCSAAAHGNVDELTWLLDKGLDPSMSDYDLRTPLHLAAEEFHLACVTLLLARGANINAADRWGTTPLAGVEAVMALGEDDERGEPIAKLLRGAGGSSYDEFYLSDGDGTPVPRVHHSPGEPHVPLPVPEGPEDAPAGAELPLTTMFQAAAAGKVADVQRFLNEGKYTVNQVNYDGRSALHVASENGHLKMVNFLLEHLADVEAMDRWGNTALKGAESNLHFKVAGALRDRGAKTTEPKTKSFEQYAGIARRWWEERLCHQGGLPPAAHSAPSRLLREVLARDYGFDLQRHRVLQGEVIQLEEAAEAQGEAGLEPTIMRSDFMKVVLSSCNSSAMARRRSRKKTMGGHSSDASVASMTALPIRRSLRMSVRRHGSGLPLTKSRQDMANFVCRQASSASPGKDVSMLNVSSAGDLGSPSGPSEATLNGITFDIDADIGHSVLSYVVTGKLAVSNWPAFVDVVKRVFDEVLADEGLTSGPRAGKNADYIPELANAPSDRLGIAVCTVDGQTCSFGDSGEYFSVQSTGKGFAYTLAMREHTKAHNPDHEGPEGAAYVHLFVGQEPSGRAFNDFALTRPDERGLEHPFNPVTNSGSIVTCSMIDENNHLPVVPGDARSHRMESRLQKYKDFLSSICGGEEVGDCMDVFESERSTAFNNYALANFMKARGTFPPTVRNHDDLREAVDFYLRMCSSKVNARMLATAAATYATFGTCPLTGTSAMTLSEAKQTLAILFSCGMYDFSGEWACTVGLPAKSGVSGNIFVVVPGMLGMCVWSPRLDALGNSVRGIRIAQLLEDRLSCSLLDLLARKR